MFWQYKLDTFEPNGLNEREVPVSVTKIYFKVVEE